MKLVAWLQWLMPVILGSQEAEIRRIRVGGQSRQIVRPCGGEKPITEKGLGGVAQGVSPEFKPQYHKINT
jgi:hypothetical protein